MRALQQCDFASAGLDSPTDYGLAGYDAEKAAARTAVQAAAGALINVTCQTCDDIVLCAGPREETCEGVSPLAACSKLGWLCLCAPSSCQSRSDTVLVELRCMLLNGGKQSGKQSGPVMS